MIENAWAILNYCGGSKDYEQAKQLIGPDEETWKPYFWTAVGIVHQDWFAVFRLANALVGQNTLSAKEAYAAWVGPNETTPPP